MPIDYQALSGAAPLDARAGVPMDGPHRARLEQAKLYEGDKGTRLITEWSDEQAQWTSWNRFDPDQYGLPKTQALLDGLGIDRAKITDDLALEAELAARKGHVYLVETESRQGSRGDKWFTDTVIVGDQGQLVDMPADTNGLPERGAAPDADLFDDDDIPF